jgi:AcrR family transcriptional regulator
VARPRGSVDRPATRKKIIRAAAEAFAKSGYHSTSLSEIAASAGMRAPSLLYHFPSKEVLFDEVIRHAYRQFEEELTPIFTSADSPRAILLRLFKLLLEFEERNHGIVRLLNAELLSPDQHGAAAIRDTMMPLIEQFEDQLRAASGHRIHPDAPVRQALLHIMAAHAMRTNLGELADEIWGTPDHELALASALFDAVLAWPPTKSE